MLRSVTLSLAMAVLAVGCAASGVPTSSSVAWPIGTPQPGSYISERSGYSIVVPREFDSTEAPLWEPTEVAGFSETWGPLINVPDAAYLSVFTAQPEGVTDEASLEVHQRDRFEEAGVAVRSHEWMDVPPGRAWVVIGSGNRNRPVVGAWVLRPDGRIWGLTLWNGEKSSLVSALKSLRIERE